MKNLLIILSLFLVSCSASSTSQKVTQEGVVPVTTVEQNILLLGDSWSAFMSDFAYDPITKEIKERNLPYKLVTLTKSGMRAEEYIQNFKIVDQWIRLQSDPKYMIISIGGNDMLKYWNADVSKEEQKTAILKVHHNVTTLLEMIHAVRPKMKIILVGLDYPKLSPTEGSLINEVTENIYNALGQPTPEQVNQALVDFGQSMVTYAKTTDWLFYSNNFGIGQHLINKTQAPGNYPEYIPFAGGDLTQERPAEIMTHIPG